MAASVVIDASVAIKWFLIDEQGTQDADDLLQDIIAGRVVSSAPALLTLEICNVLRRAARQKRMTEKQALDSISDLFDIPIQIGIGNRFYCQNVLSASLQYNLPAQDAAYLALAINAGSQLATSDARLAVAAEKAGVSTIRIGL